MRLSVLACVLLLTACASNKIGSPPASPLTPRAGTLPPSLQELPPQSSFSEAVRLDIQTWENELKKLDSKP
jgi:hypothetical protein